MKIGLSYINQIRGGENSGQKVGDDQSGDTPTTTTDSPTSLGGWVALQLSQLVASVAAGYHTQHNTDDTHGTISADGCSSMAGYSEHGRAAKAGDATPMAYGPANFTASGGMTWAPTFAEQVTLSYSLLGHTVTLWVVVSGITAGVASDTIFITIPAGLIASLKAFGTCIISDNGGGLEIGKWFVLPDGTTVGFQTMVTRNFIIGGSVGSDTAVFATCQFQVR